MNKLRLQKFSILIVLVCVFVGFLYLIEIQPRKPENASSLFSTYEQYLKRAQGDVGCLEVYVEPVTKYQDYDYYVTVCNTSDQFVCGTLQLVTGQGNVCFEKRYINIKPYEEKVIAIDVEYVPVDYKWKKVSFYDFEYPKVEVETSVSYDYDEDYGYYWMNVMSNEELSADECLEYSERMYIQDILAGSNSNDIFFYDRGEVVYIEKANQQYPDINSSYMAGSFDGEVIQIIDIKTSEIVKEKLLK